LIEFFEEQLLKEFETISPEDMKIYHVVDSVDEAFKLITKEVKKCKNVRQL
jgi:predicted Rossmann-fold nucleotide-binding protein